MPPARGRSGTRKGSVSAGSGKKAAPKSQDSLPAPDSALNSAAAGLGPTYQCGAYLRDLNDEEKKKVANLIQQIVHLGAKVQSLEDANAKFRREASGERQSPHNRSIAHTNAQLRTKLTTSVTMLRHCQHVLRSEHVKVASSGTGQAFNVPDIDAFAASCVPLGIADQRTFAHNSSFPAAGCNQEAGVGSGWHSGEHTQPNTPNSPKADCSASAFSFPQPPNEPEAETQGPRSPSRASSTPQPRPKRSRKSQSPLPRSPGKLPEPFGASSAPQPQPYLSPRASPQRAPTTTAITQPSISAPYLSERKASPLHFVDACPQLQRQHRSLSPKKPNNPGCTSPQQSHAHACAASPGRHRSPSATSPKGDNNSRSPSKPPGTFGTSPRFDYLGPPGPTPANANSSNTMQGIPAYLSQPHHISNTQPTTQQRPTPHAQPPSTSAAPPPPHNSTSSFLEATLRPDAFQAAFSTAVPIETTDAAAPTTSMPDSSLRPHSQHPDLVPPQAPGTHQAHAWYAPCARSPSFAWPQQPPSNATEATTHQPPFDVATVQQHGPFRSAGNAPVSSGNGVTDCMHEPAVPAQPGPAAIHRPHSMATGNFPESIAGDPSVTTPQTHASAASSAQDTAQMHACGMHGVGAPEATVASSGCVEQQTVGAVGNVWEGIGAPWSTFAQNFTGVSDTPPWGGQLSGVGGRMSPSDIGSGSSAHQPPRDVSFQESEDVHVHIHFDGPSMHPQPLNQPLAPPPFSPECMDSEFQHIPEAHTSYPTQSLHPDTTQAARARASSAAYHPNKQQFSSQPRSHFAAPLVAPPTLPLQPLTRLIEFDDSLADLVTQVEASMHVSDEAGVREPSAREASDHACTVLSELEPQYHQSGGYRCDSATSVSGDKRHGLDRYMHAQHAQGPRRVGGQGVAAKGKQQGTMPNGRDNSDWEGTEGADRLGVARSKQRTTRCGEVRTTSLSGEMSARHRSDTALHRGSDFHRARCQNQENSSWPSRCGEPVESPDGRCGGVLSPCDERAGRGNISHVEDVEGGKLREPSIAFSHGVSTAPGRGRYGTVNWSDGSTSGRYAGSQHNAQHGQRSRAVGSPSCLDEQDREMLDVLNCLM